MSDRADDFDVYKQTTGQDAASKWMKVNLDELLDSARRPRGLDKTIGCDISVIPKTGTTK